MKFTRFSIVILLSLTICTMLFISISGSIDFELPWRTKNPQEIPREFGATAEHMNEIPPNHNIDKAKVAKSENQYKEKLEAMMRILHNLSSNTNSQEASAPETPPTPNIDETKVAKLENEVHQYAQKLEAMMKTLHSLSSSNSDFQEATATVPETTRTPNMEEAKVIKLENEVHEYSEKLDAMMRILQNLSTSYSDSKEASVPAPFPQTNLAKEETLKEFDGYSIKIISNPNFCSHPDIEVVILVISRPTSFSRRIGIRTSYGDPRLFPTIRVFFVIGPIEEVDMSAQIGREHLVYGDIVLTDRPLDAYRNTSFKVLAGLYYIDKYCKSASFVLKTDEDMLINSFNLLNYLKTRTKIVKNGYFNSPDDYQANGSFFCNRNHGPPIREVGNPWHVPEEDYPGEMYPESCSGMGVMFDRNIVSTLYAGSFYVKHLNIEDIFFPGLVRKAYSIPIEFVDRLYAMSDLETGVFFHGMADNLMFHEKWNWVMVYEAVKTFKDGNRSIPLNIDQLSPLTS